MHTAYVIFFLFFFFLGGKHVLVVEGKRLILDQSLNDFLGATGLFIGANILRTETIRVQSLYRLLKYIKS